MQKPKLLIATNNQGKLEEIQAILKDLKVELLSPADLGLDLDVEEDGQTYAENASKKALAFSQTSGLTSLADDSGLEVEALGGRPGLHSNRFGPPLTLPPFSPKMGGGGGGLTDASRRAFLLQNLNGKPRPWVARFRATVAIASPGRSVQLVEGVCPGEIIPEERGTGGFGYDPIFLLANSNKTMAELEMDEKNRLSHRGQAIRNAIPMLIELLET
ncbi:MAG: RdgB/HAM1 family non-canonical purine NTP pyrophosphatase [Anaerolineales bacterium]|nr:RdgB/HAM1 family non-canonical purine NTP pyrophosphatase [Anaerolineales bacterium]